MVRRGFRISTTPPSYAVTMVGPEPSLREDWRWTTPSTAFPIWSLRSFWPQWLSTCWPWWLCVSWPRSSVLRTVSYPNMCIQVTKLAQEATHGTRHTLSGLYQLVERTLNPGMMVILIHIPPPSIHGCICIYVSVSSQDYLTILWLLDQLFLARRSTNLPSILFIRFLPFPV